jgi:hypothetical protein
MFQAIDAGLALPLALGAERCGDNTVRSFASAGLQTFAYTLRTSFIRGAWNAARMA